MKHVSDYRLQWIILIALFAFCLTGCGLRENTGTQDNKDTGFVAAVAGNYDSADTAVLVSKNKKEQTATFLNLTLGRTYTLSYDGATFYSDKYGQALSLEQITPGEMVDVTFMKGRKRLNSMALTSGVFRFENITDPAFRGNKIYIGKEEYTLDKNAAILTGNGLGEWMDLTSVDKLTILGLDHTIYSIVVETGHGYLRLTNESYFVGGWVEISQSYIYPVEEDMLLTVPAGTYDITISGSGSMGSEKITIQENEEYVWDVSKWQGEEKIGTIVFTVSPDKTRIYIDGEAIDVSGPQELSYGIHQMIAVCDGYETISKYIKVNAEYSTLDVTLKKKGEEEVSENSASDNSASANDIYGNQVSANESSSDSALSSNKVSEHEVSNDTEVNDTAGDSSDSKTDQQPGSVNSDANNKEQNSEVNTEDKDGNSEHGNAEGPGTPVTNDVLNNSGKYKIYIDGPEETEVFVDGSYVGIAPVSFEKKIGSHDITLRKSGYQTRTYTISVDDSEKDVNYSFSELLPISDY